MERDDLCLSKIWIKFNKIQKFMKRMHKVSCVIMIVIAIVFDSVNALADGPDYGPIVNKQITVGNLGYSLSEDDMVAVLNIGNKAEGDVVIPSKVRYDNKVYTVAIISRHSIRGKCN